MILTRHSSSYHCLSYYHGYDFNSSFEFLPYFVILTRRLNYYNVYDFNSSFKFLPNFVIRVLTTFVI